MLITSSSTGSFQSGGIVALLLNIIECLSWVNLALIAIVEKLLNCKVLAHNNTQPTCLTLALSNSRDAREGIF